MKKLKLTVLVLLPFLSVEIASTLLVRAEILSPAPAFTLTDINGQSFSLSGFRGKPVVLSFVATRSVFCKMETITLANVSSHLNGNATFILLGASNKTTMIGGDTDAQLRAFSEECNFTGIVARDTASVAEDYGVTNIPTTFIIDYAGNIVQKFVGVVDASENVLLSLVPEFSSTMILLLAMVLCTFGAAVGVKHRSQ